MSIENLVLGNKDLSTSQSQSRPPQRKEFYFSVHELKEFLLISSRSVNGPIHAQVTLTTKISEMFLSNIFCLIFDTLQLNFEELQKKKKQFWLKKKKKNGKKTIKIKYH